MEFEAGEPVLEQAQGPPELGDVDLSEFRRFLDSVSPDEFADGPDDTGRRVAAGRPRVVSRTPAISRFVRASSSVTSRSRPASLSGPALAAASAARSARSRSGIDAVEPGSA